jgi:protein tyrosine phosphatase (PTP) superfamily phosphohydrolase (DUF442 family)
MLRMNRFRRPLPILLAVALIGVLAGVSRHAYWLVVEHRFVTISDGRVYQSAALPSDDLVASCAEHGIRTVIDLRNEVDSPGASAIERDLLQSKGVRYVSLPSTQVPNDTTVDAFLDIVKQPESLPVLIHCQHGEGRSVLFAALYRIELEGWDDTRAWRATSLLPWWGNFRPDSDKGSYLLSYKPRLHPEPADPVAN